MFLVTDVLYLIDTVRLTDRALTQFHRVFYKFRLFS